MDQRSGDGRLIGRIKILALEFPLQEEGQPRGTESPKKRTGFFEEDRSPSWSRTIFECLALMTQYWIMLIYSLLFFMTILFRNSIQAGTKFHYLCQKFHPMMSWTVSGEGDSSEYIDAQLSKIEDDGEKEKRS